MFFFTYSLSKYSFLWQMGELFLHIINNIQMLNSEYNIGNSKKLSVTRSYGYTKARK